MMLVFDWLMEGVSKDGSEGIFSGFYWKLLSENKNKVYGVRNLKFTWNLKFATSKISVNCMNKFFVKIILY